MQVFYEEAIESAILSVIDVKCLVVNQVRWKKPRHKTHNVADRFHAERKLKRPGRGSMSKSKERKSN